MKLDLLIRIFLCIAMTTLFLYLFISKQNEVTSLRLEIPHLVQELEGIKQKIAHLEYEVERFENPIHLMELSRKPQYGHLRQPRIDEVIIIDRADS